MLHCFLQFLRKISSIKAAENMHSLILTSKNFVALVFQASCLVSNFISIYIFLSFENQQKCGAKTTAKLLIKRYPQK